MIRQRQLQLNITITITNSTHEYHNFTLETSGLAWETICEYTINQNPNNPHFKQPFLAWLHVIHVVWNSALVSWLITHRKETDEQNEAGEFTFILHFEEGKKKGVGNGEKLSGESHENVVIVVGRFRLHLFHSRSLFQHHLLVPAFAAAKGFLPSERTKRGIVTVRECDRFELVNVIVFNVYWCPNKGLFLLINEIKYQFTTKYWNDYLPKNK